MSHQGSPLLTAGVPLAQAKAAMILIHGRGASAESILSLTREFDTNGFAFLAPQANGYSWYPYRFTAPLESNEPFLSSALARIGEVLAKIETAGIPPEKVVLLGFSQGACLVSEFAARNAKRYGGVVALSGGMIGPDDTPRDYMGSLSGTPVFLGCSDVDPHIPLERVQESTRVLRDLGGDVTERIYPNMDHTVNRDEIAAIQGILSALLD